MVYQVTSDNPLTRRSACLVLGIHEERRLSDSATALDRLSNGYLSRALERTAMTGKRGQSLLLLDVPNANSERVLLIGCGHPKGIDARRFCRIAANTARALATTGATDALFCLSLLAVKSRDTPWKIRQLIAAWEAYRYRFNKPGHERETPPPAKPESIVFAVASDSRIPGARQACDEGRAIAAGMTLARDLGNLPGNICTPVYLAEQAVALGEQHSSLQTTVLDESAMEKLGMGALLAISRGSSEPARLIVLEYTAGDDNSKPVVLVGKGVTFDSGGLSLKPPPNMDEMKFDMCGAASVLGTLHAAALLDLPINLVGVIAAVENMPDAGAVKPGDIVTSMAGSTIEILNTDAEGRLALCDALTYCRRFKPAVVIDIATLTGACLAALGRHPHGLFSNSQSLSDALLTAGRRSHDRPWPLPLWDDYQEQLDSNFADLANLGGRTAGAITAACFLARFTRGLRWAHLDIAGTAWRSGSSKGATGRPVPLLTQFLLDRVRDRHVRNRHVRDRHVRDRHVRNRR